MATHIDIGSDFGKLKERIRVLVDLAEKFQNIYPGVYYDTGAWSAIKLLTVLRFVPIYTRIIPKFPEYFKKMYYVELLAGTGLCRIRPQGDIVAGSTLIAATLSYTPFDEYILVERDSTSANALGQRMKTVAKDVKIFNCDCNGCIDDIMSRMVPKSHYLAFVDCEGLDVDWTTMEALFSKPGDVLFNFQTQGIARTVGRAKKGSNACRDSLNRFFGGNEWKKLAYPDDFLSLYAEKIQLNTNRKIVLSFPVKGPRGFRYDVLLATRYTRGGSPWIKPMIDLRENVEKYRFKMVERILDILKGRIATLNSLLG